VIIIPTSAIIVVIADTRNVFCARPNEIFPRPHNKQPTPVRFPPTKADSPRRSLNHAALSAERCWNQRVNWHCEENPQKIPTPPIPQNTVQYPGWDQESAAHASGHSARAERNKSIFNLFVGKISSGPRFLCQFPRPSPPANSSSAQAVSPSTSVPYTTTTSTTSAARYQK